MSQVALATYVPPSTDIRQRQDTAPVSAPRIAEDYGVLGKWCISPLSVLHRSRIPDFVYWLAVHGPIGGVEHKKKLLKVYHDQHPGDFFQCRGLSLFDQTLGLRGEMAFTFTADPYHIPDNPPEEIVARYTRAILEIPDATFWCLEPVAGRQDDGVMRFLTLQQVREEMRSVLQQSFALAEQRGPWIRGKKKASEVAVALGELSYQAAVIAATPMFLAARALVHTTVRAGVAISDVSTSVSEWSETRHRQAQLRDTARRRGLSVDAYLNTIDPIMSFTCRSNPNLHRMLGHWFHQEMPDGQIETSVHL